MMDKLRYVSSITHHASRVLFCLLLATLLACQSAAPSSSELRLTGSVEGTQVEVVAEVGGRVTAISVAEGDSVRAGDPIIHLDDAALTAQVMQAAAAVSAAEANLAQVKAGTRAEAIAAAEAAVQQARAERDGAQTTSSNTLAIRANPQELTAQIDAARAGVKLAGENVDVMQTRLEEARYWRDFYGKDKAKRETLDKAIGIAQKNLEAAQAQLDGAQAQLNALVAMRAAPVALESQVNAARSAYSVTLASVRVAEASLAELKAGPTTEEVAKAQAQLHQAQAQLKLAQAYQARATITAPLTGFVAERSVDVGETVQPGGTLLSIVNLDVVEMTVYVPQAYLPRLHVGGTVKVLTDAYASTTFEGQITAIAQQAEFSSRDTQSKEDRANIVFAVTVTLPNSDLRLKAGMAADVIFNLQ